MPDHKELKAHRDRLRSQNQTLRRERDEAREALAIVAEACRLNLVHYSIKDEQALCRAYETAQAVLKK